VPTLPEHAPLVIVGGGPVGVALALALQNSHADPLLLEARREAGPHDDARYLALAYGSRLILERLGAWKQIEPLATPILHIEVTQSGSFGRTALEAREVDLPALGYVIPYRELARVLSRALARPQRCATGVTVTGVRAVRGFAGVQCDVDGKPRLISASLVGLADGGRSLEAQHALPSALVRDYRQWAVVAWVRAQQGHGNRACERFTPSGPAALLPAGEGYSVVITSSEPESKALVEATDVAFCDRLQSIFGARAAGLDRCSPRSRFPLALRYAATVTGERVVLLGNSAQTLHPVAGQGFNLGLRDAWTLAQTVLGAPADELGDRAMLARYRNKRARDRVSGILVTDSLVRLFSNDLPWLRSARGIGLAMLDFSDVPKRFLMRRMMFGF
jgi:2-octaprenyl-6-methoxyphenol hydroxylase